MNVNMNALTGFQNLQNNVKMASAALLNVKRASMDDHEPHANKPHATNLNNASSNCCGKLA